jgi:WD40 repeat protein
LARLALLFVKRHRMVSALLGVLVLGAAAFTARLARSEREARESAGDARRQAAIASTNAVRAAENAERADEQARHAAASERVAREEREDARIATASARIGVAEAAEQNFNAEAMRRALEGVPADLRGQQWRYLDRVRDASVRTVEAPLGEYPVAFFPHPVDPDVVLSLDYDKWVRSVKLSSGVRRNVLKVDATEPTLAVSPDGKRVAVVKRFPKAEDGSNPAVIQLWDVAAAKRELEIPFERQSEVAMLKFSRDGLFLLLQHSTKGELVIFDSKTGARRWDMNIKGGLQADFVQGTNRVAVHFGTGWVMHFHSSSGAPLNDAVRVVSAKGFSYKEGEQLSADPGWASLFFLSRDVCRKVETTQGRVEFEVRMPPGAAKRASVLHIPPRKIIATLSMVGDATAVLQLWNESDGSMVRAFPVEIQRNQGLEWSLVFCPGSELFPDRILVARGRQIKVFNLPLELFDLTLAPMENIPGMGFTFLDEPWKVLWQERRKPRPDQVALSHSDILDLRRKPALVVGHHDDSANPYFFPSITGDGKRVACWRRGEPQVKVLKVVGNVLRDPLTFAVPRVGAHFQISPDGSRFWAETMVYRTDTGAVLSKIDRRGLAAPPEPIPPRWVGNDSVVGVMMLADPDAAKEPGSKKRGLVLWNVADGTNLHSVDAPDALAVSASPDGTQIAEAGSDMKVRLRDAETLEVGQVLRVHDAPVFDVAWHPKLPLLATCSEDFLVRIWNLRTEELVQEFWIFPSQPKRLMWCPDGSRLAVSFASGEVGLLTLKLPKP